VIGNVSDASVCPLLIEEVIHDFDVIDILVNNAGAIPRAPAEKHTEENQRVPIVKSAQRSICWRRVEARSSILLLY
jgi:NAD(P)-dependent dehydrogenase (short-subunit alcohol dehydrogenase family)